MEFTIFYEFLDRKVKYKPKNENDTVLNTVLNTVQKYLSKIELSGNIIEIWNKMGKCEENIQFKQLKDSKHLKIILLKDIKFILKNEGKQESFTIPVNLSYKISKVKETLQKLLGSQDSIEIENCQNDTKVFDILKKNQQLQFTLVLQRKLQLLYESQQIQQEFNAFQTIRQIKKQLVEQQAFQGLNLFQIIRQSDNLILDSCSFIDDTLYQLSIKEGEKIVLQKIQLIIVKIQNLKKEYQIRLETTLETFNEFIQKDNQIPNNTYRLLYNQQEIQQFEDIIKNVDHNFMIELTLEFQYQIYETILCDSLNLLERQQFFIHPQLSICQAFNEEENTECAFFWKNIELQKNQNFLEQNLSAKSFIVKYKSLQQFNRKNNMMQFDFSNLIEFKNAISKAQNYKKIKGNTIKIKLEDFHGQIKQQVINLNKQSLEFEPFKEQDSLFIFQNQFVNLNDKNFLIQLQEGDVIKYSSKFQVQLMDESSRYIFRRFYNFKEKIEKMKSEFQEEFPKFKDQEFKIILDDDDDDNQKEVQMQDQFIKYKTLTMKLQFKTKFPIVTTLKIQFQDKNKKKKEFSRIFNKKTVILRRIKTALMEEFSIEDDQELYYEDNLVQLGKNLLDNGIINNDTLIFQKSQNERFQIIIIYEEKPFGIPYKVFSNDTLYDLIQKFKKDQNIPEGKEIDLFYNGGELEKSDLSKTFQELAISEGSEIEVQI